jgi:hypothetical protein
LGCGGVDGCFAADGDAMTPAPRDLSRTPLDRWPSESREEYEERAGIMQHCGGLTREAAEKAARACVALRWAKLRRGLE